MVEIRTWAYGRKILIVRLTFLVLFALAAGNRWRTANSPEGVGFARGALALLAMLLLSLVLVNAQAVTALTADATQRPSICCWFPTSRPRSSSSASWAGSSITPRRSCCCRCCCAAISAGEE